MSRWVPRTTLAEAVAEARSDVAYKTVITALGREKDHLTPLWLQRAIAVRLLGAASLSIGRSGLVSASRLVLEGGGDATPWQME